MSLPNHSTLSVTPCLRDLRVEPTPLAKAQGPAYHPEKDYIQGIELDRIMRSYIRHPADIPIAIRQTRGEATPLQLANVSQGGLSLISDQAWPEGAVLNVCIDLVEPTFCADVCVAWCRRDGEHYRIGVRFLDPDDVFTARMVEQVCHIEQYKQDVQRRTGRRISSNQAAREWISRHAADFPPLSDGKHRLSSGK